MPIAKSKVTAQGAISVPAAVRKKLGVGPDSVLESARLLYIPCALVLFAMAPVLAGDSWANLFSGEKFDQWRSTTSEDFPTKGWTLKDGIVTVHASSGEESGGGGDIISRKRYANFELVADFKTTPGANGGIKIFVQPNISPVDKVTGKPTAMGSAIGLEFQILDDERHPEAKLGQDGDRTIGS